MFRPRDRIRGLILLSCLDLTSPKLEMRRASFSIRALFAVCLLVATFNHAKIIVQHGLFWDFGFGSQIVFASRIYWDLLTVLDPLAAVLLFFRPRTGIGLTVSIIVSDVLHNTYYVAISGHWLSLFYVAQVGFLVVVLALRSVAVRGLEPGRHAFG